MLISTMLSKAYDSIKLQVALGCRLFSVITVVPPGDLMDLRKQPYILQ